MDFYELIQYLVQGGFNAKILGLLGSSEEGQPSLVNNDKPKGTPTKEEDAEKEGEVLQHNGDVGGDFEGNPIKVNSDNSNGELN